MEQAGAMENWGLVTYRESAIMIDVTTADLAIKQRVAMVIAHELAHQWFGNLVTMTWWCDLWLNEGFASWMQHFVTDALFPEWRIWESYAADSIGMALKLDSLRSSHPIQVPIAHAEEVEEVFDAISYAKGSTVVNMARKVLGAEKFREGLQIYMNRHKYSNTETVDLWTAWSEASGTDMNALMNSWTCKMGHPFIKVLKEEWGPTEVKLTLEQRWFLVDGTGESEEALWNIPLVALTGAANAPVDSNTCVAVSPSDVATTRIFEKVVKLPSSDAWVRLNSGLTALARVAHSDTMVARLQPAIVSQALGAVDRAALLDDQYSLAIAGLVPIELTAKLLPAYRAETAASVWKCIQPVLLGIHQAMEVIGGEALEAFMAFARGIVAPAVARFGWEATPGEEEVTRIARSVVVSLAETFCAEDASVAGEAKRRFDGYFSAVAAGNVAEASAILSSDIKGAVFRISLKGDQDNSAYNNILSEFTGATEDEKRRWAINTLGSASSVEQKRRVMEWAISGAVKLQDIYSPMISVSGSGAVGADVAWDFFKTNFNLIQEKVASGNAWTMQGIIVGCCSKFCTASKADEVEQFFAINPIPSAARKVSQIIEKIRVTASFVEKTQKSSLATAEFWKSL